MKRDNVFGRNLDHLLHKAGIQQNELAKELGVSKSAVSMWVSGSAVPRMDKVQRMTEILNCTVNDLLLRPAGLDPRPIPRQGTLPVIGIASAGKGVIALEDIIDYAAADEQYCNSMYFYIQVSGDSMSPLINDGDLVLVHRQTSVDSGSIGVFIVDGEEGYIKKVQYDEEHIDLVSFNPYYPVMRFQGPDVLRVYVVGRVVEMKRKF